ncbi:MAG: glutamate racemase [Bacteroidales bacterium]|nr:glutamate racemase [Bacteroidales bacterium]
MIGIFDSGVGGLSVFREIRKVLPEEKYIYFSDSAHCPYGEKTREYVTERSREITRALLDAGADIIVVACNTATAAAIAAMREEFPVSFIGMEPAVKPAALSTRTGVVGVLATAGTLKADKYLNTRGRFSDGIKIVEHVGQGFVEAVEKGITTGPETEKMVKESLAPLLNEGADRIVLGCTHYPFLMETIKKVSDEMFPERGVEIIDPAPAVARHLLDVMEEKGLIRQDGYSITLKSSGDMEQLQGMYKKLIKE